MVSGLDRPRQLRDLIGRVNGLRGRRVHTYKREPVLTGQGKSGRKMERTSVGNPDEGRPEPRTTGPGMLTVLVALVAVAVVAFAGGYLVRGMSPGAASSTGTPSATASRATYAYKDMVVGFIQLGAESGWRAANTASFKETAVQLGITLKFYDSQDKIENQISALQAFSQDPAVNVIVLDPVAVTEHAYDTVLEAVGRANKLVIIAGDRIDADPSLYYTMVASDFESEGSKAGTAMCDALKESKAKNVVEIQGDPASPRAIARAAGYRRSMSDCGITITQSESSPAWDPAQALSIMTGFLAHSHDIQGVIAQDDEMAVGAIQAIDATGLKAGKDVQVVGFDATPDGFKYLISGELFADAECNPLLAPQVYDAALKGLNADASTPKWIPAQESMFFASQGADALQQLVGHSKY
jgi:ABC-type sugar transport system substrate-binding protein